MSTSKTAVKTAQAASRVVPVQHKYTVQSTGIWERIRRLLAVDPSRSTGIPLNPQFRNPPPGSNAPNSFVDPVTVPAGDIAENAYFKRDARRAYPQLAVVGQADLGALLRLGNAQEPRKELIGEAGKKEIMAVLEESSATGALSTVLAEEDRGMSLLGPDGLPPKPASLGVASQGKASSAGTYELSEEPAYPEKYPCRTFQ